MLPNTGTPYLRFSGDLNEPSAVVVRPITLRPVRRTGFFGGPLPVLLPGNATTDERAGSEVTSEKARRTLLGRQQSDVLFGRREAGTERSYRVLSPADGLSPECVAVECFSGPQASEQQGKQSGFLVLHLAGAEAVGDHLDLTHPHTLRRPSDLWGEAAELAGADLDGEGSVRRLNFITADEGDGILQAYALLSGRPSARVDDLAVRAGQRSFTLTRSDWRALVLRDGASFVSLPGTGEQFGPTLKTFVHSIYTDALLLALLQRRMVDEAGDSAVHASLRSPEDLAQLEKNYFDFKRQFWRVSLTDKRTSPTDEIFRAFQDELLTPSDVEDVESRVMEGARVARTMYAEVQATTQQDLAQRLSEVSAVIGSLLFAFAAATVVADPSWTVFFLATAVGVALAIASVTFLRWAKRRADHTSVSRSGS